jgi:hypothetical protein
MKAFYFDVESEIAHFRDHLSHAFLNRFLAPHPHTIIGFVVVALQRSKQKRFPFSWVE